jgi:hypothetical protein
MLQGLRQGHLRQLIRRQLAKRAATVGEQNAAHIAAAMPFEALKDLTRHHGKIDQAVFHAFIDGLAVSDAIKAELKLISPFNFTGRDEN